VETIAEPTFPRIDTDRVLPSARSAQLAGFLAAAVALGVGELVASLSDEWQSLVVSVANGVVDLSPGDATRTAIGAVGTADKPLLVTTIVAVCLVVGALVGPAAARRPWVGLAAFAGFGALGLVAGRADDLASPTGTLVTAVAAAGAGLLTLFGLLHAATPVTTPEASPVTEHPTAPHATRRSFFAWAGAAGVVAAGSAGLSRSLRGPSRAAQAREEVVLRPGSADPPSLRTGLETEIPGLSPLITPNEDFYRIDTAILTPQVDPADWELQITGMVDRPITLTYDELLELAIEEWDVTLSCVSNEVGGRLVGNARWSGVPLSDLLDRAGVQGGATQVVGHSVDGWTAGFPTEVVYDGRPVFVAVGMNGEPLPIPHGFPARLVVAGLYGYVSATKWLSEIELTTWEDVDGYWIPRGWSKEGPIKTQSRIDVPRPNRELTAGPQPVAGVAWAGERAVSKVEVQVDDGEWQEAQLGDELATTTWRQWVFDWDATPGEHTLRVRATDGDGETQTSERAEPAPNGATGWDQVSVRVV
jgi:DMSO/TMAO reductase YedYZ molybdopterin-dependent catalytic subunit